MDAEPTGDADLLTRFTRQGDREALGALFERHAAFAYRTALGVLGHGGAAEDAVQEAFLKVIASAGSFDPALPFRPWLKVLVVRTALNRRRGEGRRVRREEAASPTPRQEDPSMLSERKEAAERLNAELGLLPEEERLPITLHYRAGCSYAEISRALDWPEGTVARRISNGKERLRSRLATAGILLATAATWEEALASEVSQAPVPETLPGTLREMALAAKAPSPQGSAFPIRLRPFLMGAAALLILAGAGLGIRARNAPQAAPPAISGNPPGALKATSRGVASSRPTDRTVRTPSPAAGIPAAKPSAASEAVLYGQVTCLETGLPVAGIRVELLSDIHFGNDWMLLQTKGMQSTEVLTDAEGRYRIVVDPGPGPHYRTQEAFVQPKQSRRQEQQLASLLPVHEDPFGVQILDEKQGFLPFESWQAPLQALKARFPDKTLWDLSPEEQATALFTPLFPGEERKLDFRLSQGVGFQIRLLDAAGGLSRDSCSLFYNLANAKRSTTHGDIFREGIFRRSGLDPAEVDLDLTWVRLEISTWKRNLSLKGLPLEKGLRTLEITLPPAGDSIAGRVLGPDGIPWKGSCRISCWPKTLTREEAENQELVGQGESKDGAFELRFLPDSPTGYRILAEPYQDAQPSAPVLVPAGGGRADLTLQAGWELCGKVQDEQGQPVPEANLHFWFSDGGFDQRHWIRAGQDGSFSIRGLPLQQGLSLAAYPAGAHSLKTSSEESADPIMYAVVPQGEKQTFQPSGWRNIPPGTLSLDIRLGSGMQALK